MDAEFLTTRALPYLLEAAAYFETLFALEEDGCYHAQRGTGYEGWVWLKDATTELACAAALFRAVIQALHTAGVADNRVVKWQQMLDHLAPFRTVPLDERYAEKTADGALIFTRGGGKGRKTVGDLLLASGFGIAEGTVLCSMVPNDEYWEALTDYNLAITRMEVNEPFWPPSGAAPRDVKGYDGIFPAMVEQCAVYPAGVIGLSQRGSELFNAAVNTSMLFSPDLVGYDPLPVVMARLGMADLLWDTLATWPDRTQWFPNGWGHYGRDIMKAETGLRYRTVPVRDADNPDGGMMCQYPTYPFRHMTHIRCR